MTTASYTMRGDTTEIVKSGPPGLETIGGKAQWQVKDARI